MQVEFEYHAEDAAAVPPIRSPEETTRHNVLVVIAGFILGVVGLIPSFALGLFWVGVCVGIVYFSWLYRFTTQLFVKPKLPEIEPDQRQVRLADGYLESAGLHDRSRIAWSHIDRIDVAEDAVLIYLDQLRAYVIPRRAFADADQMRRFAEKAEQLRVAAISQSTPAIGLYDDDFFAAWTRDAGLSVEYENTRADWAFALTGGVVKARWQEMRTRAAQHIFYLCFSTLLLAVTFTIPHIGFAIFSLIPSAAFLYVGAITLFFLDQERRMQRRAPSRWLDRRTLFISPSGGIEMQPYAITCFDWLNMALVTPNSAFVYLIYTSGAIANVVPKRSFPSFGQAEHFAQEAVNWHKAAYVAKFERDAEAAEQAKRDAGLVDQENPFRSPQT